MVLAKSDIAIASRYAELVTDADARASASSPALREEWQASIDAVLAITRPADAARAQSAAGALDPQPLPLHRSAQPRADRAAAPPPRRRRRPRGRAGHPPHHQRHRGGPAQQRLERSGQTFRQSHAGLITAGPGNDLGRDEMRWNRLRFHLISSARTKAALQEGMMRLAVSSQSHHALGSRAGGRNMDFKNKVAVVTGGSNGIGRASALGFATHGARVVIVDRDVAGGEATAGIMRQQGGEALFVAGRRHRRRLGAGLRRQGRLDLGPHRLLPQQCRHRGQGRSLSPTMTRRCSTRSWPSTCAAFSSA